MNTEAAPVLAGINLQKPQDWELAEELETLEADIVQGCIGVCIYVCKSSHSNQPKKQGFLHLTIKSL